MSGRLLTMMHATACYGLLLPYGQRYDVSPFHSHSQLMFNLSNETILPKESD